MDLDMQHLVFIPLLLRKLHFQKLIIWQQDFTVSKIKIVPTLLRRKAGTIPG